MINQIDQAVVVKMIASEALTQLNLLSVYPKMAIANFEPGNFEYGAEVGIRKAKRRSAQSINPRVSGLSFAEGSYINSSVILERLFGDGFPIYSADASKSLEKYIKDTAFQMADAIVTANEEYMSDQFRAWSATTGVVTLGVNAPIAIAASTTSTGAFGNFDNALSLSGTKLLNTANVPGTGRFGRLTPSAHNTFLGDAITFNGFVAAGVDGASNGSSVLQKGLALGQFFDRHGVQYAGSNVNGTFQAAVTDLDTASSNQATLAVASTAQDVTFFFDGRFQTSTPVGAVAVTLAATTALTAGVAVGKIAQFKPTGSAPVTAFGVILRIDNTVATAPVIYLVPYSPNGTKLVAAQIVAGTDLFSIPFIPSISEVHHQEALLMATRLLAAPERGSGAVAGTIADPNSGLSIQVFSGGYDVGNFSSKQSFAFLTGTKHSDFAMSALLLSL